MRIVEKDFIIKPNGYSSYDIAFLKTVKNKETGESELKAFNPAYGCRLYTCIKKIVRHRLNTKYESESVYLLDALKEIIKLEKEIIEMCHEEKL